MTIEELRAELRRLADFTEEKLVAQAAKAEDDTSCRMVDDRGNYCALGHHLRKVYYDDTLREMDQYGFRRLPDKEQLTDTRLKQLYILNAESGCYTLSRFGDELRMIHDDHAVEDWPEQFMQLRRRIDNGDFDFMSK